LKKLEAERIAALGAELRAFPTANQELRHLLHLEADYFARNAHRMRYPEFRQQAMVITSRFVQAFPARDDDTKAGALRARAAPYFASRQLSPPLTSAFRTRPLSRSPPTAVRATLAAPAS
jgi:hypothetical protein